jgi:hypothetical protein
VSWYIEAPFALILTYLAGWFFSSLVARTFLAKAVVGRSHEPWKSLIPSRHLTPAAVHVDDGDGPMDLIQDE